MKSVGPGTFGSRTCVRKYMFQPEFLATDPWNRFRALFRHIKTQTHPEAHFVEPSSRIVRTAHIRELLKQTDICGVEKKRAHEVFEKKPWKALHSKSSAHSILHMKSPVKQFHETSSVLRAFGHVAVGRCTHSCICSKLTWFRSCSIRVSTLRGDVFFEQRCQYAPCS